MNFHLIYEFGFIIDNNNYVPHIGNYVPHITLVRKYSAEGDCFLDEYHRGVDIEFIDDILGNVDF
jgi:hypothetical protein